MASALSHAGGLISATDNSVLLTRLDTALAELHALPARLYLFDARANAFYAAAAFGAQTDEDTLVADLPRVRPATAGAYELINDGAPVGVLRVPASADHAGITVLAQVLGPALVARSAAEVARDDLREAQAQVGRLADAAELLRHLDVDVLLTKLLETFLTAVRAQVGAVLAIGEARELKATVTWGLRDQHLDAIRMRPPAGTAGAAGNIGVVEHVAATGRTLCLDAAGVAARLDLTGLDAQLTGLLALPLLSRGRTVGVIVLANPDEDFAVRGRRVGETLCALAAIAVENALLVRQMVDRERLQQELAIARSVQGHMFPGAGLDLPGCTVTGGARPCSETGGDYFTWLGTDERAVAMIGDVSGHGLGAALFTTMAHALIQQQLRAQVPLAVMMRALNEGLFHTHSGRFMTAALVELEPRERRFRYLSAGHTPLLWLHKRLHGPGAAEMRWLDSGGMPLGVVDDLTLDAPPALTAASGDLLVLYTDGFIEAINPAGEPYGQDRFAAVVQAAHANGANADTVMALAHAAVDTWVAGGAQEDDLTMVVIGF